MEQINLNIIPDGVMPVCHASQFDKNRTIRFNLNQNGSVYTLAGTETITCKVRKPDDTESTINVANTSSSYVDVTFGFSDTDLSGYAMCELKIVNGAQTIGSRNFLLRIEADAYDGSVFEERSASGEIASFETNFIDNLTECIVDIDAVQDLHGYSKPWSGGGGKNKLNYDAWKTTSITRGTAVWENNGVTLTATGNDCYTGYTSPYFEAFISVSEGDEIWISWEETTNTSGNVLLFTSRNGVLGVRASVNNATAKLIHYTVTAEDEGYISWRFGVTNSGDTISYKNIQIEKGSQATSWEPYENICPISGHTEANLIRCGKNFLNYDAWKTTTITRGTAVWENNGVTITASANDAFTDWNINAFPVLARVPISEGETITISWEEPANKAGQIIIFPNASATGMVVANNRTEKKATYTATSGITFVTFRFGVGNSGDTISYKNIQVEKGSTATAYEQYNATTYNIPFGQTVYGGSLNVTTGVLTSTHGIVDLGTLSWTKGNRNNADTGNLFYVLNTSIKARSNVMCTIFRPASPFQVIWEDLSLGEIEVSGSKHIIACSTEEDTATFKTAMNGVQLVYELATPTTVQLTPTEVRTLLGNNNIFADTGDIEVKYLIEVV